MIRTLDRRPALDSVRQKLDLAHAELATACEALPAAQRDLARAILDNVDVDRAHWPVDAARARIARAEELIAGLESVAAVVEYQELQDLIATWEANAEERRAQLVKATREAERAAAPPINAETYDRRMQSQGALHELQVSQRRGRERIDAAHVRCRELQSQFASAIDAEGEA